MTDATPTAKTAAQRVAASRARAIAQGAQRLPSGLLPPDAARALDALVAAGWAPSRAAAIARALLEAHKNHIEQ